MLKIEEAENNSEKLEKQLALAAQLQGVNQRVSINVTTMLLPDEQEVEVSQFFIGVSHGWYVSNDGHFWGSGSSQLDGWLLATSGSASRSTNIITDRRHAKQ